MGDDLATVAEGELLKLSKEGNTRAFDELITRNRERIYMHTYHMVRNEDDALDITQETFIRAWKSLARFDGASAISTWLHRIATNAAIDLCRRRQSRPQTEIELGPMKIDAASRTTPASPEKPGTGIDRQDAKRRIEEAFTQLTPEHRAVIILKEIDDLTYEEIAQTLDCSIGTVMSRLFYARKKLQALLRDLHDEL